MSRWRLAWVSRGAINPAPQACSVASGLSSAWPSAGPAFIQLRGTCERGSEMSIWRVVRYRVRAAAGIVLAVGVAVGAAGAAGPAQAQPVLRLPPRSAAVSWGNNRTWPAGQRDHDG